MLCVLVYITLLWWRTQTTWRCWNPAARLPPPVAGGSWWRSWRRRWPARPPGTGGSAGSGAGGPAPHPPNPARTTSTSSHTPRTRVSAATVGPNNLHITNDAYSRTSVLQMLLRSHARLTAGLWRTRLGWSSPISLGVTRLATPSGWSTSGSPSTPCPLSLFSRPSSSSTPTGIIFANLIQCNVQMSFQNSAC